MLYIKLIHTHKGENMFTTDTVIDTIQNSQKNMVSTMVKDENLKKGLESIIDSQANFARVYSKTVETFMNTSEFSKNLEKLSKMTMSMMDLTKTAKTSK